MAEQIRSGSVFLKVVTVDFEIILDTDGHRAVGLSEISMEPSSIFFRFLVLFKVILFLAFLLVQMFLGIVFYSF